MNYRKNKVTVSLMMLLCMTLQLLFPLTGISLVKASEVPAPVQAVNNAETLEEIQAAIESPDLDLDL